MKYLLLTLTLTLCSCQTKEQKHWRWIEKHITGPFHVRNSF